MAQYVDTKTAYRGQVRKVVLLHILPAERAERCLVSIDVLEHMVRDGGLFRMRRGPRVTRKVMLEEMADGEALAAAEQVGRESGTPYICIVRDNLLAGDGAPTPDHRDAAD
jgi:hypothetical protein